ncbi:MAG: CAP domain-containing protein [Polyangiaceae bacterium]
MPSRLRSPIDGLVRAASTLGLSFASLALVASASGCSGGGDTGSGGAGGATTTPPIDPFPSQGWAWSHGDPSALEQSLLELVQRARANPAGEVDLLLTVPGVPGAMKQFNVDEQQLRDDFATYAPVPPLSFDAHLMESSRFHSEDMAKNGFQDHDGSAGESFDQRITDAGYDWSFVSENIFAYAKSVAYCEAGFLIDWGNPDPGHRKAILDIDGKKRDIGISIIEDPPSMEVGPLVVTQDFGAPLETEPDAEKLIVGVAYRDKNGNGAYDPGEGAPGMIIVPQSGTYHAITSTSGGYSIPMSAKAGLVKVQIQDEESFVLEEREVTLDGENVKLDFVLP